VTTCRCSATGPASLLMQREYNEPTRRTKFQIANRERKPETGEKNTGAKRIESDERRTGTFLRETDQRTTNENKIGARKRETRKTTK
jgi:hypothetical protein